ncbi:MAG: hypothetical protein GY754_46520 [bacterium]|nr:hypothetical protein [bacterium]
MQEYERPVYNLIKTIEELILSKKLPEKVIYSPDKSLIPKKMGKQKRRNLENFLANYCSTCYYVVYSTVARYLFGWKQVLIFREIY